ncbi:hypothetical protein GGQ87_000823 [Brevundimonas alba]|uniref:Calcineurin-like phosphoesterase domain-containing protein n=1 Tax=Brevundimonas alba TaxID=74314 RepID=A0A7X6BNC1_9CAUL|nr:hypothetical protein [Brevundimonas alba]
MKIKRAVDNKDGRFPLELRNIIADQPTKVVFKEIYRLMERGGISAALFMGDLTDIGDQAGYLASAKYIAQALQLGTSGAFAGLPIGIVPGNHDINRTLAAESDLTSKFGPLLQAMAQNGLPPLPVLKPIWMKAVNGAAVANIALLNSCWGCGSKEFIPPEFREGVSKAIEDALAHPTDDPEAHERTVRAYYDRQFDTPAFSEDTIRELAIEGSETQRRGLLVACAHHNILPQRLTRLAPYTELVNSGAFRSTLAEMGRPIIYLHGHIHEDPIEILQVPGGDPVVSISAPAATAGFNILDLVFTRSGIPLSCQVTGWRFNESGILRPRRPIIVPLIGRKTRSTSGQLAQLYGALLATHDLYWSDVVKLATTIYDTDVEANVEEALELLASDGSVSIENYREDRSSWIVGARI